MSAANLVPLSPIAFLNRSADVYPDRVGVVRPDGCPVTYAGLRGHAAALADRLRPQRANRVAVLALNDLPLLAAHFGVPAAGCSLVALNTRLSPDEYRYILDHCRADVLIVDASLAPRLGRGLREAVPGLRQVIRVGPASDSELFPVDDEYDAWVGDGAGGELPLPSDENDAISVNYTSGTTGRPKGVVYSHRGASLAAMGVSHELGLTPDSVYLWTLPMFHCNGWTCTWAVTAAAATHVCQASFAADETLTLMLRHGVTHFCGAPVVLSSLVDAPAAATFTATRPIRGVVGGAPPSPAVLGRAAAMNLDITHLYGVTETYGPALVCEPQPAWTDLDPVSRATLVARQGVRTVHVDSVRVVDADVVDVPADGQVLGEIVVRSNSVMVGYLNDEPATREAFRGGWLHTGDLAVRHPDGYIEIRDRAKDVIISGGENISSIEVENILAAHPAVLEAAVVAKPSERWGESPVAFVALRSDGGASADELIGWVRERLAHFKAPKEIHFGPLPRTSTGKVRKNELRERARMSE